MNETNHDNGIEILINGKVQGVGFRPYVWQLAHTLGLLGDVSNDGAGVIVHLWQQERISIEKNRQFLEQLKINCPPLASILSIKTFTYHWPEKPDDFKIVHSGHSQMDTFIVPDAATCKVCLVEVNDPKNRRYHYPFINCTHCGPRFTIIEHIPYDRAYTSMKNFALCPECKAEYENPADRRFHAQPNACPVCGPHTYLTNSNGDVLASNDESITYAAQALLKGQIIAIKGLGGFHLACDATNAAAVNLLRARKTRPNKPFAVMLPNADWLPLCTTLQKQDYSAVNQLLTSTAAPIVLVPKAYEDKPLCEAIAPGLMEVGIMLPSNPLQHLLLQQVNLPLVMTSGNARGKPPALSNEETLETLNGIADLWLMHNRDIVQRADDSVIRFSNEAAEILRRARGYVPDAMALPDGFEHSPPLIAMGGDLKNTFCLLRGSNAILSQHFGDLEDLDIQQQVHKALDLFQNIYQCTPKAIAIDAHPSYISHQMGKTLAQSLEIPTVEVYHHHAHIASCMAEHHHAHTAGPVIGLALDGLGYGADGALWGGECLLVDYEHCQRLGGLPAVALPGGDLASRQPWRNLLAQFLQFVPQWQNRPESKNIPREHINTLTRAINQGLNTPVTSSTGRLFDAVAAALGIVPQTTSWEGEAPCLLEALAQTSDLLKHKNDIPVTMPVLGNTLDLGKFWQQWLQWQASPADRAYAFHYALAAGFAELAKQAAQSHSIDTIALSGGVLHNSLLRQLFLQELEGFTVYLPARLPAGDGGIALGQALIAHTLLQQSKKPSSL